MAALEFSGITGVLASRFEDALVSLMNRSVPLAALLPVTPGQGKNIQWVVRSGTDTGSAIADGADVSTYNSDTKTPATLQWAVYHDAFAITGLAYEAARASGNPAELADLFMEEMGESLQRLAVILGTHLYTGNAGASPGQIAGLVETTNGALKATGTYAAINKASVTQFQGNELLNGGILRPLSFQLMHDLDRTIYEASGFKPDLYVCAPVQHERMALLYQAERRYVKEVSVRGQTITLDGGVNVLEWNGRTVLEDRLCPSDKVLGLNTQYVQWKALPSVANGFNRAMGNAAPAGTPEMQLGQRSLPFAARIQPLAITGDKFKFALYVYCQAQVKKPNACGVLGDLAA